MSNEKPAAPPPANDELHDTAREWINAHQDEDRPQIDASLATLLAQVAARERWEEHILVCPECTSRIMNGIREPDYCPRGAELQKAVEK